MSWFQHLDQIAGNAPPSVGYSAYCLAQLRQSGLPVADGWVLPQDLWQNVLAHIARGLPNQYPPLDCLSLDAGKQLQSCSQSWQRALEHWFADPHLNLNDGNIQDWACPYSPWVLRSSLWLATGPENPHRQWRPLHLMLSDVVGSEPGVLPGLQQLWQQALKARSLLVWGQTCQHLAQVGMATLLQPLYPAVASGRLTLQGDNAYIEVVEGLPLALARGEAIPTRCSLSLRYANRVLWQPGYQERLYRPAAASPGDHPHPGSGKTVLEDAVGTQALQVTDRPEESLIDPLSESQVAELLWLAQQARDLLAADKALGNNPNASGSGLREAAVELEWVLSPSPAGDGLTWLITQAMPWWGEALDHQYRDAAKAAAPVADRSPLSPPPLPQVSVVVKGVGASSGRVRARAVVAQNPQMLPEPLPAGCIVVLPDLQPDRFLQLEAVAGIVTEQGGATCHAAILAREMGIPAVVGAPQATQLIDSDLLLWLDGERGLVYGIGDEHQAELFPAEGASSSGEQTLHPGPSSPSMQPDAQGLKSLRTKVMVNLSQSKRVRDLPVQQIDGIGLLRSEWLMLEILDRRHPWHWIHQGQEAELQTRLTQALEPILQTLGEKPVRYRSLDLRSHEWQSLEGSPIPDSNPMLGLRGTLSYTIDSRLFEVELGALAALQQAGYQNLHLMLPFVRSVEEVMACRRYIDLAGLSQGEGFALWMMAEVPSVLFLLPAYAKAGVQGIAIGSNDLTQLLLAVDRDQPTMATAYDERHAVVQMALAHLIREARRCGMTCSICGQAPARYPELIADLVAWGIDSISVEMGALAFTRETVWQAEQMAYSPSSPSSSDFS